MRFGPLHRLSIGVHHVVFPVSSRAREFNLRHVLRVAGVFHAFKRQAKCAQLHDQGLRLRFNFRLSRNLGRRIHRGRRKTAFIHLGDVFHGGTRRAQRRPRGDDRTRHHHVQSHVCAVVRVDHECRDGKIRQRVQGHLNFDAVDICVRAVLSVVHRHSTRSRDVRHGAVGDERFALVHRQGCQAITGAPRLEMVSYHD